MLTRLRFKNFKAWRDSGDIRLAPLTVLFGTNSAGKTSIPQLLLLLRQTVESPDRQRALHLGDSRALVDLGSYLEAVHHHDTSQPLEIEIDWTLGDPLDIADPLGGNAYRGSALGFHVSIAADGRDQPFVSSLRYGLADGTTEVLDVAMRRHETGGGYDLASQRYGLVGHAGRSSPLPQPVRFYGFPDEATAYYRNAVFLPDLVLELERMFRSVYYVGPLREHPRRLYVWSGETPAHVGEKGERAVDAILAAGSRTFTCLQALDSKWWGWTEALEACGVSVHFLCPDEIAATYREKLDA